MNPARFKMLIWTVLMGLSAAVAWLWTANVHKPIALADNPPSNTDRRVSLQNSEAITIYLPLTTKDYVDVEPVFGVQMESPINNVSGLQQAVDGGAYWLRRLFFAWDQIEPQRYNPPVYNWGVVDETSLINASAAGLQVIAGIQFTPDWAQKYSGSFCGPIRADALDEFAQFLTALVNRYKNHPYNVRYWELGNEPDAPVWYNRSVFGCWGELNDPYHGGGYYAQMLKYAYPAIKAADPQAQVLIGGLLLEQREGRERFMEGILKNGGGPYFDMISFHAYSYYGGSPGAMNGSWPNSATSIPEKTNFLRNVLTQYGYGDKSLINTETALLCTQATSDCFETQAMFIPRAYAEALALKLKGQVYYALVNTSWRYTGLLNNDLSPKPAYHAFIAAADLLTDARYTGAVTHYPGVSGYAFYQPRTGRKIQVLWSADGAIHATPIPDDALAYDKYGNLWGIGVISIDASPVYVTFR